MTRDDIWSEVVRKWGNTLPCTTTRMYKPESATAKGEMVLDKEVLLERVRSDQN